MYHKMFRDAIWDFNLVFAADFKRERDMLAIVLKGSKQTNLQQVSHNTCDSGAFCAESVCQYLSGCRKPTATCWNGSKEIHIRQVNSYKCECCGWRLPEETYDAHVSILQKIYFVGSGHFQESKLKRLWTIVSVRSQEKKFPEHHWNDGAETTCLRNGKPIFQFNPSSLSISNRGPTLKEMHVFL